MKILLLGAIAWAAQVIADPLSIAVVVASSTEDLEPRPEIRDLPPHGLKLSSTMGLHQRQQSVMNGPGVWTLMGIEQQHVGQYTGDKLFSVIKKALEEICPAYKAGVNVCGKGEKEIKYVMYIDSKGYFKDDAHLTIKVDYDEFPYGYHGMREALIHHVAGIYEKMTSVKENCQTVGKSQKYTFCNVAQWVKVSVYDEDKDPRVRNIKGMFWVSLRLSSNTTYGHFDCNLVEDVTGKYLHSDTQRLFIDAMHGSWPELIGLTECT